MSKLPPDGTEVSARTYRNDELELEPREVRGVLATRETPAYTQCFVGETLVDPATVLAVSADTSDG